MDTTAIQRALIALGYSLPRFGADGDFGSESRQAMQAFQRKLGLTVTSKPNAPTIAALQLALTELPKSNSLVPVEWMPKANLDRVIVHWTAGQNRASSDDCRHYHILWESDGTVVRGLPSIDKNDARGIQDGYAAHTLNCNTGSIGVSLCGMTGAVESPFSPGPAPITKIQWDAMITGVAQLCLRYGIPVTNRTVLTHAEVQSNLGIRQRGKWDIARLPFDKTVVGAKAIGDLLRQQVAVAVTDQR